MFYVNVLQATALGSRATTVNQSAQSGGTVSMPTTPTSVPASPGLPAAVGAQPFTGRINLTISNGNNDSISSGFEFNGTLRT